MADFRSYRVDQRMTSATTPASTNLFDYTGFDLVTETQNG